VLLCYRCVKLLCKYGCDIKAKVIQQDDKTQKDDGIQEDDTALHIAARNGHLEIVKFILDQGLDLELR